MSPDRVARVQAAWEHLAGPAREAWLEHKSHCSGVARHSHASVENGWFNVARKWYGVTDASRLSGGPDVNFLEADEAFIDVIDCPIRYESILIPTIPYISLLIHISILTHRWQTSLRECSWGRQTKTTAGHMSGPPPATTTLGLQTAASCAARAPRPAPTRPTPTARVVSGACPCPSVALKLRQVIREALVAVSPRFQHDSDLVLNLSQTRTGTATATRRTSGRSPTHARSRCSWPSPTSRPTAARWGWCQV